MLAGGLCDYAHGSQLAAAVQFLHAHRKFVALVTIDIGANDLEPCGAASDVNACATEAFGNLAVSLPRILAALREAAGPDIPIVAMNYYNPFLAFWLAGPDGQLFAQSSATLLGLFNALLAGVYGAFGVPVADVETAFSSADFTPVQPGGLPRNVLVLCQLTWSCTPPPQGPNIHANADGYRVIAGTLAALVP
jgi:lysophospholipase L1-like esterase